MPNRRCALDFVMLCLGLAWFGLVLGCEGRIGEAVGADPDLPVVDAASTVDSAAVMDAPSSPPIDASIDASIDAPIDAPPIPPATCDELYGDSLEYMLCDEQPSTCEFNVRTNGGNCNQLCSAYGGTCVAAYDNTSDPGAECARIEASGDDCTTNRSTEICVCSRF